MIQNIISCPIINAGSGQKSHPTQALLDVYTMRYFHGEISNLNVLIVGDILHSRVAKSNIQTLEKFGAKISLLGPKSMLPEFSDLEKYNKYTDELLESQDIIMLLRIQFERMTSSFIGSNSEYYKNYGFKSEYLSKLKKNSIILHPGPVNSGLEIDDGIIAKEFNIDKNFVINSENHAKNQILSQVSFGVFVRMAVILSSF